MPVNKLSIQDFAAKIKEKYPSYKDVNDTLLTQKIIEKYPEYKDMVNYQVNGQTTQTATPEHKISHTPLQDIRHLNDLSNAEVPLVNNPETGIPEEDQTQVSNKKQASDQYGLSIKELADKLSIEPDQLKSVVEDFPNENDENRIKQKAELKKENPATYERLKSADENIHLLYNKGGSSVANAYNELQGSEEAPIQGLEHLKRNINEQREMILSNLSGYERARALRNQEKNQGQFFNATNPEIQNEYNNNEDLKGRLNVMQYAGLKNLQAFDPSKYKLYSSILAKRDDESNDTVQMKIGLEKAQKELLDIGRRNTEQYLNEKQYQLDKAYKDAPSQEEKNQIAQEFLKNKSIYDSIEADTEKDGTRFPYLKDLEFERQARELSDESAKGVIDYAISKMGRGIGNSVKSIQNAESNLLGSDQDIASLNLQRLGESEQEKNEFYLKESDKTESSAMVYKFDKTLENAANSIKSDKSLSEEQKLSKITELVKNNQDQVHSISNTGNFGKTANFFSKATLYKNAGLIGDIASIAAQQAGMNEAGTAKFINNTLPMYLSSQNEFYKQALEEGKPNPMAYANTHSAIMMAAGLINPDIDIAKRTLGDSQLGKTIAGISKDTWDDVVSSNKPLLAKLKNSLSGIIKETAKMGAVYGAGTSIASDLVDRGLFNNNISNEDILNHAVKATRDITTSSIALLGLHGITNFKLASPQEKARFWELGDNPKLANEQIDEAVKKGDLSSNIADQQKSIIKLANKLIGGVPVEDAKGRPLTDQQRADYLYNLLLKNKIDGIKVDLPDAQKDKLEAIKREVDIENNSILDPKTEKENLMQRKRELTAELEPAEDGSSNLTPLEKKTRQEELDNINEKLDKLNNPPKSAVSVLLPENISKPETITIKPKEDAVQKSETGEIFQRQPEEIGEPGSKRGGVESGQQGTEIAGNSPEKENKGQGKIEEDWPFVEEPGDNEVTSIRNAVTQEKVQKYGLIPALREAKRSFPGVWDEAVKKVSKGFDVKGNLVDKLNKKPRPISDTENAMLLYYQATKEADLESVNKDINESYDNGNVADFHELNARKAQILDDLQDIYDVDKKVGTSNARGLNARKMMVDRKYSLSNMMVEKRASEGGRPLTEEEQAKVESKYNDLKAAKEAVDKRIAELEKENEALKNRAVSPEEIKPTKSKRNYSKERKDIIAQMRADLLKAAKGGDGLTSSIPMAAQLKAVAPHIAKLVKSFVDQGFEKIEDVTKGIYDILKPEIPELELHHVHDLIAEDFNEAVKRQNNPSKQKVIKDQAKQMKFAITDPELMKLRADYEREKASWGDDLRKAELANRSKVEKIQDTFVKWQRAFKLSGITTLAKLAMAGATRIASTPIEEGVGAVYSKVLPKGITQRATGESGLNVKAEAQSITKAFTQGLKDSADILSKKRRGQSDIEAIFGKHELPPEAIGFFGQLHSAIKAPIKRAAFERSMRKRIEANLRNGVDVTDPLVQTKIAVQAYKDGQRAIFMQDNLVADAYRKAINALERNKNHPVAGKSLATALQWLIPFVKVPTNIIGEVQKHTTGVLEGSVRLGYQAMKNGLKDVSEEEADTILRCFKKGSVGLGALAIGFFNADKFGGFYQKGQKQTEDKLKPGSAKILGIKVPVWLLESPLFQTMQLGATVRKLTDAKLNKEPHSLITAAGMAELDLIGHEPLVDQPSRISSFFTNPKEREYFLGELAKGTVVPALVSNIAEYTDPAIGRKPETIMQHIQTGIPGLREEVSTKKDKKAATGRLPRNTGRK